jgi:hypothetical protein
MVLKLIGAAIIIGLIVSENFRNSFIAAVTIFFETIGELFSSNTPK